MCWEILVRKRYFYMAILPPLKSKSTSKFVELISPAELDLLIDERWRNLGKGVCELYIKVNLPIKFHADIFCSHRDMFHTKFKYEKNKGQ